MSIDFIGARIVDIRVGFFLFKITENAHIKTLYHITYQMCDKFIDIYRIYIRIIRIKIDDIRRESSWPISNAILFQQIDARCVYNVDVREFCFYCETGYLLAIWNH